MVRHRVRQGECILSIAHRHGWTWDALWNHADNTALRQLRADPSVLAPGDEVIIPDRRSEPDPRADARRHRYRRTQVPAMVRIQVCRDDVPRANEPYTLTIGPKTERGNLDADGMIEMSIPASAKLGHLTVGDPDDTEIFQLRLGTLDPIDTENGALGRLHALGYNTDVPFAIAVREFQRKEGLGESGTMDGPTRTRLEQRFGE
ncbi:MAG: hypothetical protein CMJ31_13965 [Phycisphaerae bacterium]|nr:hypothetical protein [Phycisphaerae bacterium]